MVFCRNCGKPIAEDAPFCQSCGQPTNVPAQPRGASYTRPTTGVSPWWWLLPICFAVLGGAVSYLAARELNLKTAKRMLILGVVMTPVLSFILLIFGVAILTAFTAPIPA